jgi:penicillin amidase
MEGKDSSYFWQGMIPQEENPHQLNPERNFVSSANQYPVDPANYPYYLGGQFAQFRALTINRLLSEMTGASLQDMMKLQTSNYNLLAEMARPIVMRSIDENNLGNSEKKYFELMKNWDLQNDPDEKVQRYSALLNQSSMKSGT